MIVSILFDGICCHIEPPAGSPINPKRRSVLPNVPQHIRYIEVFTTDLDDASNPDFSFTQKYDRFGISYRHVPIDESKIELLNIVSASFTVLPSYDQRIPKLKAVEPRFTKIRAGLLKPTIAATEKVVYFDITAGVLSSGPAEGFRTVFQPPRNWPVRHLGQWVQLDVEVSGNAPKLRVTDLRPNGKVRELVLKDGADTITLGNHTDWDIHGIPSPVGHFVHYYDLADPRPSNPPEPRPGQGLGTGCSDTNWP